MVSVWPAGPSTVAGSRTAGCGAPVEAPAFVVLVELVVVLVEVLAKFDSVVVEGAIVLVAVDVTVGAAVPDVTGPVPVVASDGAPGSVTAAAVNGGLDATSDSSEPPPLTNIATTPDTASVATATQVQAGRSATRRFHHGSTGVRHSSGRAGQG